MHQFAMKFNKSYFNPLLDLFAPKTAKQEFCQSDFIQLTGFTLQ